MRREIGFWLVVGLTLVICLVLRQLGVVQATH